MRTDHYNYKPEKSVFLLKVDKTLSEETILDVVSQHGTIEYHYMKPATKKSHQNQGMITIQFDNSDTVNKLLNQKEIKYGEKSWKVCEFNSSKASTGYVSQVTTNIHTEIHTPAEKADCVNSNVNVGASFEEPSNERRVKSDVVSRAEPGIVGCNENDFNNHDEIQGMDRIAMNVTPGDQHAINLQSSGVSTGSTPGEEKQKAVYVNNIDIYQKRDQVHDAITRKGVVITKLDIPAAKPNGQREAGVQNRGFGFVHLKTEEQAQILLDIGTIQIGQRTCNIRPYKKRKNGQNLELQNQQANMGQKRDMIDTNHEEVRETASPQMLNEGLAVLKGPRQDVGFEAVPSMGIHGAEPTAWDTNFVQEPETKPIYKPFDCSENLKTDPPVDQITIVKENPILNQEFTTQEEFNSFNENTLTTTGSKGGIPYSSQFVSGKIIGPPANVNDFIQNQAIRSHGSRQDQTVRKPNKAPNQVFTAQSTQGNISTRMPSTTIGSNNRSIPNYQRYSGHGSTQLRTHAYSHGIHTDGMGIHVNQDAVPHSKLMPQQGQCDSATYSAYNSPGEPQDIISPPILQYPEKILQEKVREHPCNFNYVPTQHDLHEFSQQVQLLAAFTQYQVQLQAELDIYRSQMAILEQARNNTIMQNMKQQRDMFVTMMLGQSYPPSY